MRKPWLVISAFTLWLPARTALAQVELKNDGFTGSGSVNVGAQFVDGEAAASRFTPPAPGAQLRKVRVLFAGGTEGTARTVTLRVWDDSALGVNPGAELYMGDFDLTSSSSALNEIDLSTEPSPILLPGTFRIGIELQGAFGETVAFDADGSIAPTKNFIYTIPPSAWAQANSVGLTGDWIIRAEVSDPGGAPDAGVVPQIDAGAPGTPDASIPGGPDAGAGGDCTSNAQCMLGEYCSPAGACTFDCRMDDDCGTGSQCNSLGMCVAGEGGDSGGCGCRTTSAGGLGAPLAGLCGMGLMLLLALARRRPSR